MSQKRLSKQLKDEILDEYVKGTPVQVIADAFKVHHSYPTLLARRRGLATRAKKINVRYQENDHAAN